MMQASCQGIRQRLAGVRACWAQAHRQRRSWLMPARRVGAVDLKRTGDRDRVRAAGSAHGTHDNGARAGSASGRTAVSANRNSVAAPGVLVDSDVVGVRIPAARYCVKLGIGQQKIGHDYNFLQMSLEVRALVNQTTSTPIVAGAALSVSIADRLTQ